MRRGIIWIVFGVLALAAVAVLIPGSPVYLPRLIVPGAEGHFQGRSTGHWVGELSAESADDRKQAAHALGAIGPEAGEASTELARVLTDDSDREVRIEATLALSKIAPASAAAVPALTKALSDKDGFIRMNAAMALFRMKPEDARPAVPELIKAVQDPANKTNLSAFMHTIQDMAGLALGRASAGTTDGVPALTAALAEATTNESRAALVRALGEIGPAARSAAPQVRAFLTEGNNYLRDFAAETLHKMGEQGEAVHVEGKGGPVGRPKKSQ